MQPTKPAPPARRPRAAFAAALATAASFPALAEAQSAGGAFEVDPVAAERALERALVQSGSVLLPPRAVEIVPFVSFVRRESDTVGPVVTSDGVLLGTSVEERANGLTTGVVLRTGLPWSGQVDLTLPFAFEDSDEIRRVGDTPFEVVTGDLSGFGDLRLGYTQVLREERNGGPSLLASLDWDSDTGRERDGRSLGSGFHEIEAALISTLSQDPLVFSGRLAYQRALEANDVQPGDEISLSAATFLAVNPETSLSFGFSVAHAAEVELDGDAIDGSDQLSASLELGVATIIRRNLLLDTALSIGLTDDAPAFAIQASLPLRFSF